MDANLALLDQVNSNRILAPVEAEPPFIAQIESKRQIARFSVPRLAEWLDRTPVPEFPFDGTWEQLRMQPWVILHTSGSTGTPKAVVLRHGYSTTQDACWLLQNNEAAERCGNCRFFAPFPAFHVAGIIYSLMVIPTVDSTLVFPPATPLTAEVVDAVHEYGRVESSTIPPSLIVDLTKSEAYLARLKKLKGLTYAGGPLPKPVGDMLCQHMPLYTTLGATEFGSLAMRPKDREDWAYFNFSPEVGGMEFRDVGDGKLFEMVLVRDPRLDLFQGVFFTFPEIDEYHTKDMFSKHPAKPGLWRYEGRLDDVLVLSNGEKVNPVTMEGIITSCPEVAGCVVFGQGRFQTGIIVQPTTNPQTLEEVAALWTVVWPFIERANEGIVRHGRISNELVMLAAADRPLPRAPKGTIQRSLANKLYSKEIDQAYEKLNARALAETDTTGLSAPESIAKALADIGHHELSREDDFFKAGMDSLEVMSLVRAINRALGPKASVEAKDIYDHPSIQQLLTFIENREALENRDSEEIDRETWLAMEKSFQNATSQLPGFQAPSKGLFGYWTSSPRRWIIPPDGGTTAWLQVLGSFLLNLNNWGLANSFGVFQAYFETELLADYSPSSIAWIGTLQASLILILGMVSGPLFDKGYTTPVLMVSSVLLVFALMMMSLSTQYYQVMLTWGVLTGVCSGLLYIPSVAIIPLYFTTHRGFALGVATAGAPVGGVIYPIIIRRVLNASGFGWACRAIAFIALVTLLLAVLLIKPVGHRGKKATRQLFERTMFTDLPFVTFMIAAFLLYAGFLVPFILCPTFAQQGLDEPADTDLAFYMLAIPNAAQIFGRILPPLLSDNKLVGPETLLFGADLLAAIFSLCWIAVHNIGGYVAYLIFYGFVSGMIATLPAAVLPYVSPSLAVLGTRLGMVYACSGVGALIGTPIALAIDSGQVNERGFLGAQLWTGLTMLVATAFIGVTAREARRRRKIIDAGSRGTTGVV